jgi:hypothetical protein
MTFHPIVVKLSYFRSLPPISSHRKLLLDYIDLKKIPVDDLKRTSSYRDLYYLIASYYQLRLTRIIRVIQGFRIRRQYLELLSNCTEFNFYLSENKGQLSKINYSMVRSQPRPLANQYNLIDGTKIADLDPQCRFICREKGNLYAFDLRELSEITDPKVNPYTNQNFSLLTCFLIKQRQKQCPLEVLQLNTPQPIELRQLITDLVGCVELNGGYYLNIEKIKQLTAQQWLLLTRDVVNHILISPILNQLPPLNVSLESDVYVKLLLDIAKFKDPFQNSRCMIISQKLQLYLPVPELSNDQQVFMDHMFGPAIWTLDSNQPREIADEDDLMDYLQSFEVNENNHVVIEVDVNPSVVDVNPSVVDVNPSVVDVNPSVVDQDPDISNGSSDVEVGHTYNLRSNKRKLEDDNDIRNGTNDDGSRRSKKSKK